MEGWNFAKDGVDDLFGLMKAFKLDEKKRNVIGLGHSMGGATLLLAQIKYPGLFASLVLLEPILYPYLPPPPPNQKTTAQLAASRRSTFPSLDSARASFASKPFFASWHPAALDLYVSHGFHKTPDGWTLKTTPGWESAAFTGGIHGKWGWPRLPELTCPVSIITARGSSHALLRYPNASGEVVTKDLAIASFLPHATHEWVEGSHMFPLERPGAVAKLVAGYVGKSMDREYYEEKSRGPEMGMNERGMDGGMGGMDGGLGGGMGGMDGGMGMGGGMDGLGPGTDSFLGDLDNEGGESWDEEFGRGRL